MQHRFRHEHVNPGLAGGDLADAFQRFVADLLREEWPGLAAFPGALVALRPHRTAVRRNLLTVPVT